MCKRATTCFTFVGYFLLLSIIFITLNILAGAVSDVSMLASSKKITIFKALFVYGLDKWPQMFCIGASSLAATFLINRLNKFAYFMNNLDNFKEKIFADINTCLYRTLHSYPQYLLSDKEDIRGQQKSLKDAFQDLIENHPNTRGMALDFAVKSFQTVISRGFIVFEGIVEDYTEYLSKGIGVSKKTIFASCCVRPFWFLVDQKICPTTNKVLSVGFDKRGSHLKSFRDCPNVEKKIRLVCLGCSLIIVLKFKGLSVYVR